MCFLLVVVTVSPSMKLFSEWDLALSPDQSGTVVATDKQTGIDLLQSVSTTGVDEVILRPGLLTTWRRHSLRERSQCNKPEGWGAPAPLLPPQWPHAQVRRHILIIHKHVWLPCIKLLSYFCPARQCKKIREFMFIYDKLHWTGLRKVWFYRTEVIFRTVYSSVQFSSVQFSSQFTRTVAKFNSSGKLGESENIRLIRLIRVSLCLRRVRI